MSFLLWKKKVNTATKELISLLIYIITPKGGKSWKKNFKAIFCKFNFFTIFLADVRWCEVMKLESEGVGFQWGRIGKDYETLFAFQTESPPSSRTSKSSVKTSKMNEIRKQNEIHLKKMKARKHRFEISYSISL